MNLSAMVTLGGVVHHPGELLQGPVCAQISERTRALGCCLREKWDLDAHAHLDRVGRWDHVFVDVENPLEGFRVTELFLGDAAERLSDSVSE